MKKQQGGYAVLGALMVVVALATVTTIGLSARTRDLGFEARSLRRHQARWAAESALARARMRREAGRPETVEGRLPTSRACETLTYQTRRLADKRLAAVGTCYRSGRADIHARITVRWTGPGRGQLASWSESN